MYGSIAEESTKLLVLDRDPDSAAGLSGMLAAQGWSCVIVSTVAGVLKSIKSHLPSAIIVRAALHQPEFGCDHIVRVLRQAYPSLPIVITSTEQNRRVEAIWDEFGVPCLIEPFDADELFAALQSVQAPAGAQRTVRRNCDLSSTN